MASKLQAKAPEGDDCAWNALSYLNGIMYELEAPDDIRKLEVAEELARIFMRLPREEVKAAWARMTEKREILFPSAEITRVMQYCQAAQQPY